MLDPALSGSALSAEPPLIISAVQHEYPTANSKHTGTVSVLYPMVCGPGNYRGREMCAKKGDEEKLQNYALDA
jgi:hypothetical protein